MVGMLFASIVAAPASLVVNCSRGRSLTAAHLRSGGFVSQLSMTTTVSPMVFVWVTIPASHTSIGSGDGVVDETSNTIDVYI